MKKFFIAALLTVSIASSAFAKDTKGVGSEASKNFRLEFARASEVTWSATNEYFKATFVFNNERMEAFYDASGEKIGTSRAIIIDDLPVKTKRSFAKDYDGYTVNEAIEFDGPDETSYYIKAENEKESVILKVTAAGTISRYKVTKK